LSPADAADVAATADDDALHVLTAAMLTPARFPGLLGDDYPDACRALGLAPVEEGYGLVFGQDAAGARWTVAVTDTALVACALAAWDCGLEYDLSPDERSVAAALPGWPLPVAVAAPGLPAPHDPSGPDLPGPPLTLPDTGAWGPAQRRMGADELALRWEEWRARLGEPPAAGSGGAPEPSREPEPSPTPESHPAPGQEPAPGAGPGPGLHPGARRALAACEEYLRTPPPPGRVRSAAAGPGARMVRADGAGWSLVARTDDMAFVLLDEVPGEVLPVGRGPALPALLAGLDALAARPL
jgi:hypothetical protein